MEILPDDYLVISIQEKLEATRREDTAGFPGTVSIYRVPPSLREQSDPEAYIPQSVSLGPYHHGSPRLRQMERHKWRALHRMLSRNNQEINIYVDSMKQLEYEARACYEGELELSSNEFIEMMLLDGCFFLEILQGTSYGFDFGKLGYGKNDPIFSIEGINIHSIGRDMIMLENQIPLVVLDELFRLQSKCPQREKGLVAQLAIAFFGPFRSPYASSAAALSLDYQDSHHFLDVIRRSCFCGGPEKVASNGTVPEQLDHCVTELIIDAGIKINSHATDRLLDIKFDDGTLYIPQILIEDGTKSLLKNLIAFEQCHPCKRVITSYVLFLDELIDTAEDVTWLCYYNIIENQLESDQEVANLFHCLTEGVGLDLNADYFSDLYATIESYYSRNRKWYTWVRKINTYYWRKRKRDAWQKWNNWRGDLADRYFKNPWTIISLLAGVLLLLLTAVQTFYGVSSYYLPNN